MRTKRIVNIANVKFLAAVGALAARQFGVGTTSIFATHSIVIGILAPLTAILAVPESNRCVAAATRSPIGVVARVWRFVRHYS